MFEDKKGHRYHVKIVIQRKMISKLREPTKSEKSNIENSKQPTDEKSWGSLFYSWLGQLLRGILNKRNNPNLNLMVKMATHLCRSRSWTLCLLNNLLKNLAVMKNRLV